MGTYALSSGYYDAYYKRAQQVGMYLKHIILICIVRVDSKALYQCPCVTGKMSMSLLILQVRTLVRKSFKDALDEHDILISPAAPSAAYKIGMYVSLNCILCLMPVFLNKAFMQVRR